MPYKDKNKEREYAIKYYKEHRDIINAKNRKHYHSTIEKQKIRSKKYYDSHKLERYQARLKRRELRNFTERKRYKRIKNDLQYKISKNLRTRLYLAIRQNWKTGSAVKDLGCTIPELKIHLEKNFKEGMSWENIGVWHIDHKIPLASFDLTKRSQLLKAVHFSNLQPLWWRDNLLKSNSLSYPQVHCLHPRYL